ncbi:MAG: hypothetical protein BWY48_00377 [Parcubacteria group bacterium ADurb.Bin305]|nr:MAG: hypothetical protein BWY48_00377 [Parcubacteria group bacterium ADurb.Bin305]
MPLSWQYLVLVGAVIQFGGTLSYLKDTIQGRAKPNRVTWLLWTIAPLIATVAALTEGVKWSVLPVFMAGFCPLLVFIASFVNKNAYWKLGILDYWCGFWAILALILWGITKNPTLAVIFSIVSDGCAALPALIKAWQHPETETIAVYATALVSALTSFAAVKTWKLIEIAFPLYLMAANSLIIILILCRRREPVN